MSEMGSERPASPQPLSQRGRSATYRRGAILPLVAMSIVGLMGLMALAVEAGSLQRERRTAQTAADAAATSGAYEIYRLQHHDSVTSAVHSESTRNGFTHGVDGVTVLPNHAPATGPHAGDSQFVEVRISRTVSTFFGALLGRNTVTLDVRAVAGIPSPADNCIYTLDPDNEKSFNISGSTTRLTADCGLVINSNHPTKAVVIESSGTLDANSLAVVGGIDQSGGTVIINPGTTSTGVPPAVDPLAYLTVPNFCTASPNMACNPATTCDYTSTKVDAAGVTTLNPGIYCLGIEVTSNGTAFLNPGLYILRGGGMKISGGVGGMISGVGVTFINTDATAAHGGKDKFDRIYMDSQAEAQLSAPTSGPTQGILFWQDPAAGKAGTTYINDFSSGSNSTLSGTLYFPTQQLKLGSSGSTITINGGVVAQTVEITSGSRVTMDMTNGLAGVPPVKRVSLVE